MIKNTRPGNIIAWVMYQSQKKLSILNAIPIQIFCIIISNPFCNFITISFKLSFNISGNRYWKIKYRHTSIWTKNLILTFVSIENSFWHVLEKIKRQIFKRACKTQSCTFARIARIRKCSDKNWQLLVIFCLQHFIVSSELLQEFLNLYMLLTNIWSIVAFIWTLY